jgi:MFS family permease
MIQENSTNSISQTGSSSSGEDNQAVSRRAMARLATVGGFLGFTWGAALRTWMVILALKFGEQPKFTWSGTFGGILLPAALMGALLGRATHAAGAPDERRRRWLILSPLLMVLGPAVATKNFFTILFTTGMGGGAIGVALIGMLGGYAFSGLGALWRRRVSGLIALLLTFASGVGFFFGPGAAGSGAAKDKPGGSEAFGAIYFILLMAALVAGVSAPFRSRSKRPERK